jgi:pantoate--beta-alanine ligase
MGALHEGHISLVNASKSENRLTAASIFVNPTQFGPNEDFDRYPRTFDEDCEKLKKAGCDLVFYPSVEEMYGKDAVTSVNVNGLDKHLAA